MQNIHSEELLTIEETAQYLKVHKNTVRNLILDGSLPAFKLSPRVIRIKKSLIPESMTPYLEGGVKDWLK